MLESRVPAQRNATHVCDLKQATGLLRAAVGPSARALVTVAGLLRLR